MKLKSIPAALALLALFATGTASADQWCSLSVSPSSYVPRNQYFSYGIDIAVKLLPGPLPPPEFRPGPPFTVVFHGTKDGVQDIPSSGEYYPATFGYGHSDLTGYGNPPSGGYGGTYLRHAVVYDHHGWEYCVTNTIAVVLEN